MSLTSPLRRAGIGGLVLAAAALGAPAALADTSHNVAVIPGLHGAGYGVKGAPVLPTANLPGYSFTATGYTNIAAQLASGQYDTVLFYGMRWDDQRLTATDKAAINAFAQTHKLLVWDADSTTVSEDTATAKPSSSYLLTPSSFADFIFPFTEVSSGQNQATGGAASIVSDADGPLASSTVGDPRYIDTLGLVDQQDAIGDSSVMTNMSDGWQVAMYARNERLDAKMATPLAEGYPLVAWHYGTQSNHTGMVVYSGIGVDALHDPPTLSNGKPNYALKALQIQLGATFFTTAQGCAPSCPAPPEDTVAVTGGTPFQGSVSQAAAQTAVTTQTATTVTTTAASCGLSATAPKGWVSKTVPLSIKAVGTAGSVALTTPRGLTVATATGKNGLFTLRLDSKRLLNNRATTLTATALVGATRQCAVNLLLRVDNVAPKALKLVVTKAHGLRHITFRASEGVTAKMIIKGRKTKFVKVAAGKKVTIAVKPAALGKLVLIDRAKNSGTRLLKLR
jgi:hypothetical protein